MINLHVPPGPREEEFTFFMAVWGFNSNHTCRTWPGGWGRRLASQKKLKYTEKYRGDRSTILVSKGAIPARVKTPESMKKYHKNVMIFKASPEIKRPIKFEAFGPMAYQLRGNCVKDFPRSGEYHFAVWADNGTKKSHHYSLGIGLAERDVMKLTTTIFADYMMVRVYQSNHWTVIGIMWPIFLAFFLSQAGLAFMLLKKERESPTPFQWLVITAASILFGNVILILIQLIWAASVSAHAGAEVLFQLIVGISLPLASSTTSFALAFKCNIGKSHLTTIKKCCCCCCRIPEPLYFNLNRRITVILLGLLHLCLFHSGFIVAPVLLIVAGLIPSEKYVGEESLEKVSGMVLDVVKGDE